jgi:hypothetical protein
MASARRPSSGSRPTWRERSRPSESTVEAKRVKRWLLSVLAMMLIGLFIWRIWLFFSPSALVACLPVMDYKMLAVPPVPFCQNDSEAFKRAGIECKDLRNLQTSDSMAALSESLRDIVSRPKDTLILYVSAHGVSLDGKGYLLCGVREDASGGLERDAVGRFEISSFLKQVQACPAGEKILVLDAGHLATEPHLGLLVNEFPKLLAQAVADTQDSHLWVLTANSLYETSHVSHSAGQSAFNHFVVRGLAGDADAVPNDHIVDLAELVTFVGTGVTGWVQKIYGESQTPRILCGDANLEPLALEKRMRQIRLPLTIARPKDSGNDQDRPDSRPGPATAAAAPDAGAFGAAFATPRRRALSRRGRLGQGDSVLLSFAGRAIAQQTTADSADAKKPAADPAPATPGQPPATPAEPAGRNVKSPDPPAPADAAAAAKNEKPPQAQPPLPTKEPAPATTTPGHDAGPWSKLRGEWNERDRDPGMLRTEAHGWSPVDYAPHLWREYENLILHYELRLRARHGDDASSQPPELVDEFQDLKNTIKGKLKDARQAFLKCEACRSLEKDESADMRQALQTRNDCMDAAVDLVAWHAQASCGAKQPVGLYGDIEKFVKDVVALDQTLSAMAEKPLADASRRDFEEPGKRSRSLDNDRKRLVSRLESAAKDLASAPTDLGAVRRIEDLLSTPLLGSELRIKLLAALQSTGKGLGDSTGGGNATTQPSAAAQEPWERAREQARLEVQLIKWADPKTGVDLGQPAAEPVAIRLFSAGLAKFYRDLPAQFAQYPADATRLLERQLRLVTAGGATHIAEKQNPIPRLKWITQPAGELVFRFDPSSDKPDSVSGKWTLDGELQATEGFSGRVSLEVIYDRAQLKVTSEDGALPVAPRQWVRIEKSLPLRLSYEIQPMKRQQGEADFTLVAKSDSGVERPWTKKYKVPPPDDIELVVTSADGSQNDALIADKRARRVLLSTFPGHTTTFVFSLRHRSARPRNVSVRLLRVKKADQEEIRVLAEGDPEGLVEWLKKPAEELAAAKKMPLPGTDSAVPIPFAPFPPPPPPPAKDAPPPSPAATKPPERASIPAGLVCEVRDIDQPNLGPWVTWIEISPWAPKDYVAANPKYDGRELTIGLLLSGKAVPLDNKPININWELSKEVDRSGIFNHAAALADDNRYQDRLQAKIDRDLKQTVDIRLDVDGYPRAFVFKVRPGLPADIEREKGLENVEIAQPRPLDAFGAAPGKSPDVVVPVELRVSAPDDTFRPGEGHRVELGIDVDDDRVSDHVLWTHSTDRQIALWLERITAEGRVAIHTDVSDFKFDLQHERLNSLNAQVNLIAQLVLGDGHRPPPEVVPIIFDHSPPEIKDVVYERTVNQGASALLVVTAYDKLSGVKSVSMADDTDRDGKIDAEERKKVQETKVSDKKTGTFSLEWKTDNVDLGDHTLLVWATDKIGWESELKLAEVEVTKKPEKKADTAGAPRAAPGPKGMIEGHVEYGGPVANIKVLLEGPAKRTEVTDANGTVIFRNLPPGDYALKAEGIAKNSQRKGTATVTVPDPPKKARPVTIKLE